jgi:hypothetical protein
VPISLSAFSAPLVAVIQDRTLERVFHDALYPRLLYRAEAVPEKWDAHVGETKVFTRSGLMAVDTEPLTPGSDPTPGSYDFEQWIATAAQYGHAVDSHMPTSHVALASTFLKDTQQLGLHSASKINRIVRDRLFRAYSEGETMVSLAAGIGALQAQVASLSGFTEQLLNGVPTPVSAANPLAVTFSNAEPANTVIGAVPLDPTRPFGPGIIIFGAALGVGLPLRTGVYAATQSVRVRVGGAATIDGVTALNILTLQDIINAISTLRDANVPPHADGFYHVHLTTQGEAQIFADNAFQRLNQSLPEGSRFQELAIGQLIGARFYRNTENPTATNSGALVDTSGGAAAARCAPSLGLEVINQGGVAIRRALVTGGSCVYEKWIDESGFETEAGTTGKIGSFTITNGGIQVMTERIRYILRAPLDRLQQVVSQAWSLSGDWPVPSDGLTGGAARYKRAIIIEHG